jgi:5-methylthioribose kinase
MNYLLRVTTTVRSFILKQSRPWVEKYAQIDAPFDRALVEAEFYRLVAGTEAAEFMPRLFWFDEESRILCLEDLGTLGDCSNVYAGAPFTPHEQQQVYRFLSLLHSSRGPLPNRAMRELNHFHIFVFPFQPGNGLDLDNFTPGLQRLADRIKTSHFLLGRVAELGRLYLADGDYLLHGDCFPGSWLRAESGIKVIDPEFGFAGPREFDIGVLWAHQRIAGLCNEPSVLESHYPQWKQLDLQLVRGFAGVEILRRLLGVAQLPISFDLQRKRALLESAVALVLA